MPVIYSQELRAVFDHENTPHEAKVNEFMRLLDLSQIRGYSVEYVIKCFTELFSHPPPIEWLTALPAERKRLELSRWKEYGESRGYRGGYAAQRYKAVFGAYPTFRA